MNSRSRIVLAAAVFLITASLIVWSAFFPAAEEELKIVFFDVGQGSAVFMETPQKAQILIDGGPDARILEKLGQAMPFWDREIDLMISTHPDADHLTGLLEVLKSYQVKTIGSTGVIGLTAPAREFAREVENERAEKVVFRRGQKILIGHDLTLWVLAPLESFEGREVKDYNSSSLVLKMSFGQIDFLLTGDSPISVEKELAKAGTVPPLASEVLQVGHHGSKSSTSEEFLQAVSPKIAVIQVGRDNRYGHPNAEVLERLVKYGIRVMRTDEAGDIKFLTDGKMLVLKSK
jgi:competence protein ComEC